MTKEEIYLEIQKSLDVHTSELSDVDYVDLLEEVIDYCKDLKTSFEDTH